MLTHHMHICSCLQPPTHDPPLCLDPWSPIVRPTHAMHAALASCLLMTSFLCIIERPFINLRSSSITPSCSQHYLAFNFRFVGPQNIAMKFLKNCTRKLSLRMSSQHPIVIFQGLTSMSNIKLCCRKLKWFCISFNLMAIKSSSLSWFLLNTLYVFVDGLYCWLALHSDSSLMKISPRIETMHIISLEHWVSYAIIGKELGRSCGSCAHIISSTCHVMIRHALVQLVWKGLGTSPCR